LARQRKELQSDLEFYKNDLSKAPPLLQRKFKTNDEEGAVQQQLLAHQEADRKRINDRFDDELGELKKLWAAHPSRTTASTPAEVIRPR
jgi:hypothetical protein